jgi:hypothetical protein
VERAVARDTERSGVAPISIVGSDCCALAGSAMVKANNEIDERCVLRIF